MALGRFGADKLALLMTLNAQKPIKPISNPCSPQACETQLLNHKP